MKKWQFLVAVFAAIVLWGCSNTGSTVTETSQPASTLVAKDSKAVFEQWLAAAKSISTEHAHYTSTIDISMKGSTQPPSLAISGEMYRKGNKRFDEIELNRGSTTQKLREYSFETEVFLAAMVEGQWMSQKATPAIYFNSSDAIAELESLYQKGALVLDAGVERKIVSGQESNQVKLSVDVTKLSTTDGKFLLFVSELSDAPDAQIAEESAAALKSFEARLCLLSNGVVLEQESTLQLDPDALPVNSVVSSHAVTTIGDYQVDNTISDSLFDLPPALTSPAVTGTATQLPKLFKIEGASMEPTLHEGETLMGLPVYRELKRGDIVVFTPPGSSNVNNVKRIVGMPGETVEIKEGHVLINGSALDEPYVLQPTSYTFGPAAIPAGSYFLLGDNRNMSNDSHTFGAVPAANIKFVIQMNK